MNQQLKRRLLYGLTVGVVLVTLASLVGVFTLGDDFITEDHLTQTALVILYAAFLGLACSLSKTPRGMNLLPKAGLLMTGVSALMMLLEIWKNPLLGADSWESESFVLMNHVNYSSAILALDMVLVCLLSVVPLTGRSRWAFFIATQSIFAMAVLAIIDLWSGDFEANKRLENIASVFAILSGGLVLLILLLSRMQKLNGVARCLSPLNERNVAAIDEQIPLLKAQLAELEKLRAELIGPDTPIG